MLESRAKRANLDAITGSLLGWVSFGGTEVGSACPHSVGVERLKGTLRLPVVRARRGRCYLVVHKQHMG